MYSDTGTVCGCGSCGNAGGIGNNEREKEQVNITVLLQVIGIKPSFAAVLF